MSEQIPESPTGQTEPSPDITRAPNAPSPSVASDSGSMIAITTIIAIALVSACCILSCAVVAFAFINNAPW